VVADLKEHAGEDVVQRRWKFLPRHPLVIGTAKILSGILYGIRALDPIAFTVAPVVMTIAALIATWLPARRATRVDPVQALRSE